MLERYGVYIDSFNDKNRPRKGGLLHCANCGRILGYLNGKGCRNFFIMMICSCGQRCYLKQNSKTAVHSEKEALGEKFMKYSCPNCGTPLISFRSGQLKNFTFTITCQCGHFFYPKGTQNIQTQELTPVYYSKILEITKNDENLKIF